MSKTKKRSRNRKKTKKMKKTNINKKNKFKGKKLDPVIEVIENPFPKIEVSEKKELLLELSKNGKEKFDEAFKYFDNLLKEIYPIPLLSIISGYGLTSGVGKEGVIETHSENSINQADVELLQALILQIPIEEQGYLPVTPDIVQNTIDKLKEINQAFKFARIKPDQLDYSETDKSIILIQEIIRNNTQEVRNWGFHSQIVNISKELYSKFDQLVFDELKFSLTNVIDFFDAIMANFQEKISYRFQELAKLKSIKKPYDLLVKYHELIGQGEDEVKKFIKEIDLKKISVKQLFFMILAHYDLRMQDNFLINVEEISKESRLDISIIIETLEYFSYTFGDLSDKRRDFFLLDNPIWNKPIIKTCDGYFCPLPQVFFSFILDSFDEIIETFDKEALHKRRASYLELKIEEIVKRRFPESKIVSGLKWVMDETGYETDLIAFIDSHMIIIEAKSHKITKPALRGAPDRIKRHLKEILIEPSVQSYRFEEKINELIINGSTSDPLSSSLPVDIKNIKKVIRLSVSLEDFASLQANLGLFSNTGWLPNGFKICPSINLADFETLFDLLEHPVQIIHYLQRRSELEGAIKIIGDELDFMGLYLSTLLNIEDIISKNNDEIIITGMSESIDKYYTSKEQGIAIEKPIPEISPFFKKVFNKLEERGTPRWSEIGCILNRFPPNVQYDLIKYLDKLSKSVKQSWQHPDHKNIAIYKPLESSKYSLAIVLFKEENKDERYKFIEHASALGLDEDYIQYCLVIAINIDKDDSPYHFIGLYEAKK